MAEYHSLPQPNEVSTREREDAMGGYLMMFASLAVGLPLPIINLIAAIVYYYINRNKGRFIHFHVLQSLLSQIPTSLMNAVLVFWTVRIFFFNQAFTDVYKGYLAITAVANLLYFIFSIVAAVRARNGRFYYFLFFGKLAYHVAYQKKSEGEPDKPVNIPPQL